MKKLLFSLMFLGYLPYLFLFTSVKEVKDSERRYNCHIESLGEVKQALGFGRVYYSPLGLKSGDVHPIVLPFFFQHGEVKYASCAGTELPIGVVDLKIGRKITVYTVEHEVSLFGHVFHKETNWQSFGTNDEKSFKEGETVLTKLVDHKEVKFFGGKPLEVDTE